MTGILIYTSSSDSEGGLGGLVRQGKKDRLINIFNNSLAASEWCSNDPLCIESGNRSSDSVSLGACHSCVHIPETSCEHNNCFLDRSLVTGTPQFPNKGFFSVLLQRIRS